MCQTVIRTKLDQVRNLIDRGFVYFDFEEILEVHYRRWLEPGDTIVDIGAHIGRHLGPMLEVIGESGKAIAFEPIPSIFSRLSSEFNGRNLDLHNVALSDHEGFSDFIFAQGSAEESGLKERKFNSPLAVNPQKIKVPVSTLDTFTNQLESLSFIKIDIEGGEIDCLKGAINTIARFRPLISVEYGELTYSAYGNDDGTLFRFANDIDYVIYDMFMNKLDDIDEWKSSLNYVYWDFFLVPREKESIFIDKVASLPSSKLPDPKAIMVPSATYDALASHSLEVNAELDKAKVKLAELNQNLEGLINSKSWKITHPLRKVMAFLKR